MAASDPPVGPSFAVILREWGRIGCIGFGGPPAHIALLRELCVERQGWLSAEQFERAIAATNLLPGPASTQLAIYCAWRLRGPRGALLGGLCFILPGLILMLALSVLFLSGSPPAWLRGAGMGAGAAVAAVAVRAGLAVATPMWRNAGSARRPWLLAYALAGGVSAALAGPWLVLVLLACGAFELGRSRLGTDTGLHAWVPALWGLARAGANLLNRHRPAWPLLTATADPGGTGALVWTALKVGALAFGGGFVIVPLMQSDAVGTYHWMTHGQFLNAVALGQITPGPIVLTVVAVGYAAAGIPGGLLAAVVAFAPSFSFILLGAARFERLLVNERVLGFLAGAAPAAAGAIIGAVVPLTTALERELAVRRPRRLGGRSSAPAPPRRPHPARGRLCGSGGRPAGGADPALSGPVFTSSSQDGLGMVTEIAALQGNLFAMDGKRATSSDDRSGHSARHVHTRRHALSLDGISSMSRLGVQRAVGLPECATPPQEVYELAKRRGMDFVTITDHDTIAGVLEIADRPDVFVSEELTAHFRGEPQAVHVLCYGITPEDHEWLQAHRGDVELCAAYMYEREIVCALAHPYYTVGAPLTAATAAASRSCSTSGRCATARAPAS